MKHFASRTLCRSTSALCIAAAFLSHSSFAQTNSAINSQTGTQTTQPSLCTPVSSGKDLPLHAPTPPPCLLKHHSDTSLSLGSFSQLTVDRTQDVAGLFIQGTAPSAGTLGTLRQTFSTWLGYSVNLGYTRVSEQYHNNTSVFYGLDNFNIDTSMYESSITYVAHTPVNKHYSLFGDVGPGLLTFLPVHRGADAINYAPGNEASLVPSAQARPAGIAGTGIDLHLTPRFDLRVEYRALIYRDPDFGTTGDGPYSKALTLTNEPTFSIVYHFHQIKP